MSVEIEGERQQYGGTVLVVDPDREVSFESQWDEPLMEIRTGWLADFSANQNKSLARLRKRVETIKARESEPRID